MDDEFVAIDWGSSNFRAYRVGPSGELRERLTTDRGVATLTRTEMGAAVEELVDRWPAAKGSLYCCGMIGSSIGWSEVPYLTCPIEPERIAHEMAVMTIHGNRLLVSPGLTCRSVDGSPDVIRGEEVLCLGALNMPERRGEDSGLLCMPGTHTKWIAVADGELKSFSTSIVGELFAALSATGVLKNHLAGEAVVSPAFLRGVDCGGSGGGLARQLFTVRGRSVTGELAADESASFASGILIGNDVHDAAQVYADLLAAAPICLVGAPDLCRLYEAALDHLGRETTLVSGETACIRGFQYIRKVTAGANR